MAKNFILCKVKKGSEVRFAWIPEEIAHFGKKIMFVSDAKPDNGWTIIRVKRGFVKEANAQEGELQRKIEQG